MKWMDRPSVTEMDKGGVSEMDGLTKCQKIEMPLKWNFFYKIFGQVLECVIPFYPFQCHFQFFCHLFRKTI